MRNEAPKLKGRSRLLERARRVLEWLDRLRRSARDQLFERYDRVGAFDARYGTDTTGVVHVSERSGPVPEPYQHAHQYCPVHVRTLDHVFERVAAHASRAAFIDLGSGKGRVVLEAMRYPFVEVVGIELDDALHRISMRNFERATGWLRDPSRLRLVHGDVRDEAWPNRDLVIFAFCPFSIEVMASVVDALDASLAAMPRACTFIYVGSLGPDAALERSKYLRVVERGRVRGVSRFATDAGRYVIFASAPTR